MTTRQDQSAPGQPETAWRITRERAVHWDRPFVIGILNITPDSFSDGGRFSDVAAAVEHARRLADEGADGLDVGGESTRPGARRIEAEEQIRRVLPVIEAVRAAGIGLPITIDTTLAPVARAALGAGADAINDVSAGAEDGGMLALAAERGCGLILMHRGLPPEQDRYSDRYERSPANAPPIKGSVVDTVVGDLADRLAAAVAAGVDPACVMLDPGLGFGKDVVQNMELIRETGRLVALGRPVLSALSRKSFVGRVSLGRDSDPGERLGGTLGLSAVHLWAGARYFRVHDVAMHRQALDAAWAAMGGGAI